jgi:glycosyltransferase involved in cell wall biosynthesis
VNPDVSVFLLAYNEEDNIREAVASSLSVLNEVSRQFEVIVVVYEGSTDNTRKIVEELMSKDSRIRLVVQKKEDRGYGAAMRLGYENSTYPLIFYTDADNQFDVTELKKLLPLVIKADLVVGYRVNRKDPVGRLLAARVYNLLVRIIFGLSVRDVDCSFKLVKKEVFDGVKLTCNTGLADAELLVKAKKCGYKILEVPVSHRPRVAGKAVFHEGGFGFVRPSVVFNLLKDMIKLKAELSSKI